MNNKNIINVALGTALILGLSQTTYALKTAEERATIAKAQEDEGQVKCAGRILAGLNDCPTSLHACAGLSDEDADPETFIWLPRGTCNRIAGTHIIENKEKKVVKKKSKKKTT